jgi:undecaprenyl phosphate-alpha-L-ara4N flippase subunit ArnE
MSLTPTVFALLSFCIFAEIVREVSFKAAADRSAPGAGYFGRLLRRHVLWLGLGAWAVELTAWVAVLQRAPLTLAFPIMSLTYAAIPLASAVVLKERLGRSQLAGAALVAAGVVCVGVSGRG